jgi:hypothetical protein
VIGWSRAGKRTAFLCRAPKPRATLNLKPKARPPRAVSRKLSPKSFAQLVTGMATFSGLSATAPTGVQFLV